MPKVFVSHSFEDLDVVSAFVHLLEDGLGYTRSEIRCSSLPGYGFPLGSPFRDDIRDSIESTDVFVALISSAFLASPYCMGEIGICWGLRRSVIPLLLPDVNRGDIVGPLGNLNVSILFERGTLDALRDQLVHEQESDYIRWQDRRDQFLMSARTAKLRSDLWQLRGFWNERIVDSTLYVAADLPSIDLRQQVLDALESERPLQPHLFYVTDQGFESWLALADDPLFLAYRDSMALVAESSDDILDEVFKAVGARNIDLVSLGPGDGRKDMALLRSMIRLRGRGSGDYFYYPFDISANMVAKTMSRIAADSDVRRGLDQVKAIIADFGSLPIFKQIYQFRQGPNVLALLGNLLGNFADDFGFLRRLRDRAMFDGDLLLLEVRLRSEASENSLKVLAQAPWSTSRRFDFGPLELLGVPFEDEKLTYAFEPDRGTVRGTDTIVAQYEEATVNRRKFYNIDLSYVHRYDEQLLIAEVQRAGFTLVRTWTSPRRHNLWLLLQKSSQ